MDGNFITGGGGAVNECVAAACEDAGVDFEECGRVGTLGYLLGHGVIHGIACELHVGEVYNRIVDLANGDESFVGEEFLFHNETAAYGCRECAARIADDALQGALGRGLGVENLGHALGRDNA